MQPRLTRSFGDRDCTSTPSNRIEPLVTSPRSACSRLETARNSADASVAVAALGIDTSPLQTVAAFGISGKEANAPPGWLGCVQLSFEQSRGWIFFSAAYFAETSSTSGSVMDWLAVYQSEMTFQPLPSHCCTRPSRAPSWSEQEILIGFNTPSKPSSLRRASEMLRFSRPQRTCSPVSGFLPNFSCALRIASTPSMAFTKPRL